MPWQESFSQTRTFVSGLVCLETVMPKGSNPRYTTADVSLKVDQLPWNTTFFGFSETLKDKVNDSEEHVPISVERIQTHPDDKQPLLVR